MLCLGFWHTISVAQSTVWFFLPLDRSRFLDRLFFIQEREPIAQINQCLEITVQFQEHAINIGGSSAPHVPIVVQRAIDPGQFSTGTIKTNSLHMQPFSKILYKLVACWTMESSQQYRLR